MLNRLIIVLARKFCLSPHPNARKGGLLGLGAVMIGFNNGSVTKAPPELVEEITRPILTCLLDSDSRVRYYACESLYNVTKVAKGNILHLFPDIFDNLSKLVADTDINVRSVVEVLDKLLKDIVIEEEAQSLDSFIPKLEEYIYTKNPFTRMFIMSWIRVFDSKYDMVKYLPQLLAGIFCCLCDSSEEIRAFTLDLLSEFLSKLAVDTTTNSDNQNEASVTTFLQALCKTFRENEAIFDEQGTYVILNLCGIIKPEIIYTSFAQIVMDDKTNSKFARNLVQKLNRILLTTQPLSGLRSRLSSSEDDPEVTSFFHTLYDAWRLSPIAALTLCLLTNNYKNACEIVTSISQTDITVDTLTQIDWVVQLIESPVFAPLRMRLLNIGSNQYLLQALYGLLMILPQSEAYRRLGHRLDQVYKYTSSQAYSRASATKPTPQAASSKSHGSTGRDLRNSDGNR